MIGTILLGLTWAEPAPGGQWQYEPDAARASEVEVRFTEEDGRTRVDLEHRHIERHGADAESLHDAFDDTRGWPGILARYAEKAP